MTYQAYPYGNLSPSYNTYEYTGSYVCTNENDYRMKLQGIGTIRVEPDTAIVVLGVVTENPELKTAQGENSIRTTKVINSLKQEGIGEREIETLSYTIEPVYDYIEGRQVFRTYRVTHDLRITIKELNKVGEIIDTAVENGANVVRSIDFTILDPSNYYRQALTLALQDTIKKAETLENRLGLTVYKTPISILEKSQAHPPLPARDYLRSPQESTPIQAKQIEISAEVEATFFYRG